MTPERRAVIRIAEAWHGQSDEPIGTWVLRLFQRSLAAHGLPEVRLHSLRHHAATTVLDALGGDLRAASALLGHSSVAFTSDVYAAHADEARKRAAAAMDRAMEGLA